MFENLHTNIGKLAVEKGYISHEQLTECISILDSQQQDIKIDKVLLHKHYLNSNQLDSLQKKSKLNIKKIESQAVADFVTKMKMVESDNLATCFNIQKQAQQEQKTYIPLSKVLVSRGVLSQEKVDYVLRSKEVQRFVKQAIWQDDPSRTGLIGRVLGGYEIVSKIAEGGMGVVFKAIQLELNRTVALKILFDQFAKQRKHLNQFFREARLNAALNHPNLVHIFDVGNEQGFFYYSMELVEGVNLGDRLIEETKFKQEEALDIIIQSGRGLEHIHSFDIVHRDIKPSNFIIRHDGIVKIMDLGLARQLNKQTKKASTMGTPYYMAPELINNPQEANQRADIYALGVSFYRLLTGEYPITGNDPKEILKNIAEQIPKPVNELEPEVSSEINNIIQKMIEKDPHVRYQHMTEVLNDLDRVLLI